MNLRSLPVYDRLRWSTPVADCGVTTDSITEFFLLEECVARCESLAEEIAATNDHHTAMNDLSECIAACQTYLAAKSRESRYEVPLRAYCADALAHTAASCDSLHSDDSTSCRKIILAGLKLLRSHGSATPPSSN